jgi:hypothetical protein
MFSLSINLIEPKKGSSEKGKREIEQERESDIDRKKVNRRESVRSATPV